MAGGGAGGVGYSIGGVGIVEIGAPLPDVTEHVVKAPVIGLQFTGRVVFCTAVGSMPGDGVEFVVAGGGCTGPAGVFPLGFGGQAPFPSLGQEALLVLLCGEASAEGYGIVPGEVFNGAVVAFVTGGIISGDAFVEGLRAFEFGHEEAVSDNDFVLVLVRIAVGLGFGAAHEESAGGDPAGGDGSELVRGSGSQRGLDAGNCSGDWVWGCCV